MSTTQPIRNLKQIKLVKEYYLSCKPNLRNYTLIVMGLNTALRISDILHLTYGDIYNFEQKAWRTHLNVTEHKTGKSNQIYLNEEISSLLKKYVNPSLVQSSDWLFEGQNTQPLSRYQAYRIIKEAASYAGMDAHISCHSLRKTFGYHAWKQGTPPAILMNIYNHSSFRVTKRYLGIDQTDKDEVFQKICLQTYMIKYITLKTSLKYSFFASIYYTTNKCNILLKNVALLLCSIF